MAHVLYIACPDLTTARSIGHRLVEERLVACVNILPAMHSIYRWQGQVEEAQETVLLVKTVDTEVATVTARIVELHPYELPCVVALPIDGGHPPYLAWLQSRGCS